jgi:hypothetical protein
MAEAPSDSLTAGPAAALQRSDSITIDSLSGYASGLLAAARAYDAGRLGRVHLSVPFLDIDLRFTSPSFADLCGSVLAVATSVPPSTSIQIFAMDAEAPGWSMPRWWDEDSGFFSRRFDQTLADIGLRGFYHHRNSWQVFDPAARVGVQSLPTPLGIPEWETASPLRLFLHWAYASIGLRLTHAATLGIGGNGALVVGASGSGKSGTTIAGLLNELDSVGDDFVVVALNPAPEAFRIFRTLKQDDAGLRRAGLALSPRALNWRGKVEFDPAEISRPLCERMALSALLIPRIAHAERTRIEPASAQEAALALAPSGVFQLPGDALSGFRFFADLTRRLPAFHVHLSENPREIAGVIGDFLTSGQHRAG